MAPSWLPLLRLASVKQPMNLLERGNPGDDEDVPPENITDKPAVIAALQGIVMRYVVQI